MTAEDGRFRIERLVAGSFALRARADHQVTLAPTMVELDIGQTRTGVEIWLSGRCLGRVVETRVARWRVPRPG